MRLFIAVELPPAVRQRLAAGLAALKRELPAARWVRAEGVHLTLKFLGEQPDALVTALDAALPLALGGHAPVEVRLQGGGFFPTPRRARVAWVGGSAPGLEGWAATIDEVTSRAGVAREARPFSLHLTLARLDRPWSEPVTERFLADVGRWAMPPFTAREVVLFRSELQPAGASYTALRHWQVGGGNGA